jgi:hypothetical protein
MAEAKRCPGCAGAVRRTDVPDLATLLSHVGVDLVLWLSVAFVLAFLGAPRGDRELYAALAVIGILAWLLLRPRQLSARQAFLERARYHCETCNRHFEGQGPWRSG